METIHLQHRIVHLNTPADIVMCSYIVQNSISHLNLELCQRNTDRRYAISETDYRSKVVINTQEKCRKVFSKCRKLLYSLHLDLPKGREWDLKNESEPESLKLDTKLPHIAKVSVPKAVYNGILFELIRLVCRYKIYHVYRFKIFKWFMTFNALNQREYRILPNAFITCLVKCMHSAFDDPVFFTECLNKLDFDRWMQSIMEPGVVEKLLHQIHLLGRKMGHMLWTYLFIQCCLTNANILYVGDILKFRDAPIFDRSLHETLKSRVESSYSILRNIKYSTNWNLRRATLLLQLCFIFSQSRINPDLAVEAVRLIWNSIPDIPFSFEELRRIFKNMMGRDEIFSLYNFYEQAVGNLDPPIKPRSLRHYCRPVIRRLLFKNKQWIPEGVRTLNIPLALQSYLLLENLPTVNIS